MKYIAILLLMLTPFYAHAERIETPTFDILVKWMCEEGHVSCDNITFSVENQRDGTTRHYVGESIHSLCADGESPCRFLGYRFRAGCMSFTLYSHGYIEVVSEELGVLLSEEGQWLD